MFSIFSKYAILMSDAISSPSQTITGHGVQETSSQTTKTSVTETCIFFYTLKVLHIRT